MISREEERRVIFDVIKERCNHHVWALTEMKDLTLAIQARLEDVRKPGEDLVEKIESLLNKYRVDLS